MACAAKAPIVQNLLNESIKRIVTAGNYENIQRWCLLTSTQLSLMESAYKLPRVIIIGGSGTGKTAMLDEFATKIAKKKNEDVHVAIFRKLILNEKLGGKPLLHLSLEDKYAKLKLKNISVKTFDTIQELEAINPSFNSSVFVDELVLDKSEDLHHLYQMKAKILWIAIRSTSEYTLDFSLLDLTRKRKVNFFFKIIGITKSKNLNLMALLN